MDSFNILLSTFEMETTKLLTKHKSIPDKI